VPVKGHCLIWGMDDKVPSWMLKEDVTVEVDRRLQYMSELYRGRFEQWDVYNEQLHGTWFEEKTGNANFINDTFEKAHRLNPGTKLFLNDFNLLNGPGYTGAMVHLAKKLIGQGAPVHGIGMQSHFPNEKKLDIDVLAGRLEILGEAGLPLWATEFDVNITDATSKANWYEDVLYLLYADPNVEGIIIWGFWSKFHWRPDAALVEGMDFQENESGRRVRSLWNDVWSTRATITPNSHNSSLVVRAFHGEYDIDVWVESELMTTLQVDVLDSSPSTSIDISI
uniref:GH10 domain-containing protein n=1 Tax=Capitella teleta TaxID=283909 RepID=X1YSF7_CAPTE